MKKLLVLLILAVLLIGINDVHAKKKEEMAIGGEVCLAIPMGDFGYYLNTINIWPIDASVGFGINGLFNYQISKEMSILGSIGYFRWGVNTGEISYNLSFVNIPVAGAFHYYFIGNSSFTPFVGGELSLNFSSSQVDQKVGGINPIEGDSKTEIGITPFGGILYPLSPQINLRAVAKLHIISYLNYFSINAGILYKLE